MSLEKIDIYDINKQKTGRVKIRYKEPLEDGEYILITKAIIINSDKKILLSKRAKDKARLPGYWEINGGCCSAGEQTSQAIVREIKEEIGIDLSKYKGIFFKDYLSGEVFVDVWLYKIDIDISELKFSDREVEQAKWVTFEEYEELNKQKILSNYETLQSDDYNKCIKLLFNN